jgi:hypothetical protein
LLRLRTRPPSESRSAASSDPRKTPMYLRSNGDLCSRLWWVLTCNLGGNLGGNQLATEDNQREIEIRRYS